MGERNDKDPRSELPPSVSENIGTIAEFSARHEEAITRTQRFVEKTAHVLGSPAYVAVNIAFIVVWIAVNLIVPRLGYQRIDDPPFFWLQGIVSLNAFIISTTVLIRQNRMSKLADHHAHLDLQVNLLTDEKCSKIIALLEELRQDLPNVATKDDREADELARPADPKAVLSAIEREQKRR
jgi:uncharacterized membrane protein